MKPITTKHTIMKYLQDANDKGIIRAMYIEMTLGSNEGLCFLIANMDSGEQRTLHRVSSRIFQWVNTNPLECPYLNRRWYKLDLSKTIELK